MGRGPTLTELQEPGVASKFWAKVRETDPERCWVFPGAPNRDGYPEHHLTLPPEYGEGYDRYRLAPAYRISCLLSHGQPTEDRNVARHRCLTKTCVNPAHLHWGTHEENRQDTIEADRQARGQGNGRVKLPDEAVIKIIRMARAGEYIATTILAKELGVDSKAIRQVRDRKTWIHLWEAVEAEP